MIYFIEVLKRGNYNVQNEVSLLYFAFLTSRSSKSKGLVTSSRRNKLFGWMFWNI